MLNAYSGRKDGVHPKTGDQVPVEGDKHKGSLAPAKQTKPQTLSIGRRTLLPFNAITSFPTGKTSNQQRPQIPTPQIGATSQIAVPSFAFLKGSPSHSHKTKISPNICLPVLQSNTSPEQRDLLVEEPNSVCHYPRRHRQVK